MSEDRARRQLLMLTAVKLGAVVLIGAGLLLLMQPGLIGVDARIGALIGVVVMLTGLADLVIVPQMLRRRWQGRVQK